MKDNPDVVWHSAANYARVLRNSACLEHGLLVRPAGMLEELAVGRFYGRLAGRVPRYLRRDQCAVAPGMSEQELGGFPGSHTCGILADDLTDQIT